MLAIAALRNKLGIILVWAFNLLGTADLLHAFYEGNRTGVDLAPGMQGAAYFIPTVLVPLLLITHGVVFRLLFREPPCQGSFGEVAGQKNTPVVRLLMTEPRTVARRSLRSHPQNVPGEITRCKDRVIGARHTTAEQPSCLRKQNSLEMDADLTHLARNV